MKKILLVTHGHFASGIKSSLEIILGEQNNVGAIDAYTGEEKFEKQLEEYLSTVDTEKDTLLILTDLFGGSVNQKIAGRLKGDNIHIITGLNLPLLLEVTMLSEEDSKKESIMKIVENSKSQIQYVDIVEEDTSDDFDF